MSHDGTDKGSVASPSDDATTRAVCATCGGEAIKGGPIVPDEAMVRSRWAFCSFGDRWSWCRQDGGRFKRS